MGYVTRRSLHLIIASVVIACYVTLRCDTTISLLLVGDSVVDSVVGPCLVVFTTR